MNKQDILSQIKHGLIVSCQAEGDESLNSPEILAALSQAAVRGGAVAIRAERPENIIQIKNQVAVPIIGLYKKKYPVSDVYITPTLHDAIEVLNAGADVIALDATQQPRPNGEQLDQIVTALRKQSEVLLMADIATFEEGIAAAKLGFDLIGTTLSGYTTETNLKAADEKPDFELLSNLINQLGDKIPIIAEGRIGTAEEAVEALRRGAFAVVVGTAITRPTVITSRFLQKIDRFNRLRNAHAIGIDLGGTKTSFGIVSLDGKIQSKKIISSNWEKGTGYIVSNIIAQIQAFVQSASESILAVGLAATGRVDSNKGIVFDGVPLAEDYIGFPIVETIQKATRLPVFIENDANAAAYAEYSLMKENRPQRLVFITIGTGIGGGIIIDGKLIRGKGNAGEIGHICIEKNGRKCRCGRKGCLERYVSRTILQKEIQQLINKGKCFLPEGHAALSTDAIIELIQMNSPHVLDIFNHQLDLLVPGIETIFNTVDPDLIVLGGEIVRLGAMLTQRLQQRLRRSMDIIPARSGNNAGMTGAALLALEKF
jgi:N-acylglucosamine-6-phosphate 2-epimerase